MTKWLIGALLAATAAVPAMAQENRDWRTRQGGWQQQNRGDNYRTERARPAPTPQAQAQAAPAWQNRDGGWRNRQPSAEAQAPAAPNWRNRGGGGWRDRQPAVDAQVQAAPTRPDRGGDWRGRADAQALGGGGVQAQGGWQGRRDWQQRQAAGRPELQQGGRRFGDQPTIDQFRRDGRFDRPADARRAGDNWRYDGRQRGYDSRANDSRRYDNRAGGNWSRDWRRDDRYDWNRYRSYNRSAYHLPRYYAPYGWNGGYRRFSIGVTLSSILWGQNYWIDDPWSYRLPEAYGPYRWVRYYNDAILVDLRTGLVVDTVYDIFWY